MQGQQQLVLLGGAGLVAVNLWVTPQHTKIAAVIWGSDNSAAPADAHTALLEILAETLFVGVVTVAAGSSPSVGSAMVAVIVALWVLWAIRYYTGAGAKKPGAATRSQAATAEARFPGATTTSSVTVSPAARGQTITV